MLDGTQDSGLRRCTRDARSPACLLQEMLLSLLWREVGRERFPNTSRDDCRLPA